MRQSSRLHKRAVATTREANTPTRVGGTRFEVLMCLAIRGSYVFQQVLNANVRGSRATMYVDRALCMACGGQGGLGSMMRAVGVDELLVIAPDGQFLITASRPSVPIPVGLGG